MVEFADAESKSPQEVAARAVALSATVTVALHGEPEKMLEWLRSNDLATELTDDELGFLQTASPSDHKRVIVSRHSAQVNVLLWALGLAEIPPADQPVDPAAFNAILPPFAEVAVDDFIANATLRPEDELSAERERTWNLHWQARDGGRHYKGPREPVHLGIIEERHHAINWLTDEYGAEWDEVVTDT